MHGKQVFDIERTLRPPLRSIDAEARAVRVRDLRRRHTFTAHDHGGLSSAGR